MTTCGVTKRDRGGRFLPGTAAGPGRPSAAREARYAELLHSVVDEDAFKKLVASLLERALAGDVPSAKLLFDRILPPAPRAPEVTVAVGTAAADLIDIDTLPADLQTRLAAIAWSGRLSGGGPSAPIIPAVPPYSIAGPFDEDVCDPAMPRRGAPADRAASPPPS